LLLAFISSQLRKIALKMYDFYNFDKQGQNTQFNFKNCQKVNSMKKHTEVGKCQTVKVACLCWVMAQVVSHWSLTMMA
jgi:hypothetical protein